MLATALKAILPFCGDATHREDRIALSGICLEFMPEAVRLIASNAHVGIVVEVKAFHGNADGDTLVLYDEEVKRLVRFLEVGHGEATLAGTDTELIAICGPSTETIPAMNCKYMKWRNGFQFDTIRLKPEACYFNPSYLEMICKAFKRLTEKPPMLIYQPCGELNRAVFSVPTDRLKPGVLSARAVIMPMRH